MRLAEELLSRIENDELRRRASVGVYGPLVRKTLGEADWVQAKIYALKIGDPLGRTLVVDWVARAMTAANQEEQAIKELYYAALAQLQRDSRTHDLGKSFLILARSLFTMDPEGSFIAINVAVSAQPRAGLFPCEYGSGMGFDRARRSTSG
ncbi:MAG TPA: hypothetical protein VNM72_03515 [Blastocatellia bacterium]|nr:hypothetical protein [Blastocatellia bacterium]